MVKCAVAKRGVTPIDAPMCIANAEASTSGELVSREGSVISCRRHAAIYKPTLPNKSKALSKPSSVLPSASKARICSLPSCSNWRLRCSPTPSTFALSSCCQYSFSNSLLISTKRVRSQLSNALVFSVTGSLQNNYIAIMLTEFNEC